MEKKKSKRTANISIPDGNTFLNLDYIKSIADLLKENGKHFGTNLSYLSSFSFPFSKEDCAQLEHRSRGGRKIPALVDCSNFVDQVPIDPDRH